LPEWNGRDLWTAGSSQGGLQTMWTAGLVPQLTIARPAIVGWCDLAGGRVGRYRLPPEDARCRYSEALNYYDPVNFARRVPQTCRVEITRAGLGDSVCPASGLALLYDNIPGPKSIRWVQGSEHGTIPSEPNQSFTCSSDPSPASSAVGRKKFKYAVVCGIADILADPALPEVFRPPVCATKME